MSISDQYAWLMDQQRRYVEDQSRQQDAYRNLGLGQHYGNQLAQQASAPKVPNPEPNKVLLLLGDIE